MYFVDTQIQLDEEAEAPQAIWEGACKGVVVHEQVLKRTCLAELIGYRAMEMIDR